MPKKILVVDDVQETLAVVRRVLEREGYEVDTASNGQEGLDKTVADIPDLILLDIMMPVMDGMTMNRHLKENPATRKIPVVIVSARSGLTPMFQGDSKVAGYLIKPVSPRDLLLLVHKILFEDAA